MKSLKMLNKITQKALPDVRGCGKVSFAALRSVRGNVFVKLHDGKIAKLLCKLQTLKINKSFPERYNKAQRQQAGELAVTGASFNQETQRVSRL